MRCEFDELYNALFSNANLYISVVKALAAHHDGMCREEISKAIGVTGGVLTRVLTNLERCDFISRSQNFGHKTKDTIYRLVDFYTLFYYKFIQPDVSGDEHWWSHNFESRQVSTWQGLTFEIVSLMHTDCIKRALGISGHGAHFFVLAGHVVRAAWSGATSPYCSISVWRGWSSAIRRSTIGWPFPRRSPHCGTTV